ncbi:MAG: DUF4190 domain-containing protein [Treponema sp.]|nr:DUF4190 domain-containing protein [Treponema sp.]
MDEQGNEVFDENKMQAPEKNESEKLDAANPDEKIEYEIKGSTVIPPAPAPTPTYIHVAQQKLKVSQGVSGASIASMVLGIIGLLLLFTYILSPVSVILGIIGLVLGVSSNKTNHSGIAVAGIATSAVAMGLGILEFASCAGFMAMFSNEIKNGADWFDGMDEFNFEPFQQYLDNIDQPMNI